ncbi:MAG TPA: aldo/keto reductase [Roseiflexaceae bacterium]|nr:aldo/keto reductase [Roseiflexaceae bacterium]
MRYKLLGRSGLRVSELCLGTMTFGDDWGWGAGREESARIFTAFAAAGGNFIDTSNNYTNGTSERLVGAFVAGERERFVIASKYTLSEQMGDPNAAGNHRKNMLRTVESSLRRLGTDYLDLLYLHMWDFTTPVEEILRAFDDLVRQGKVLHIGFSDTPAWVVSRACAIAELRGWAHPTALQLEYSLLSRTPERDLLPMAEDVGLPVLAWGVLEGGELTGKYNRPPAPGETRRSSAASPQALRLAETLAQVAGELGCTPAQAAVNWVRQQPRRTPLIPILGARSEAQLRDNLGCLAVTLAPEQLQRLTEASPLDLGFPHAFLRQPHLLELIYSGAMPRIDMP